MLLDISFSRKPYLPYTIGLSVCPSGVVFEEPHTYVQTCKHEYRYVAIYRDVKLVNQLRHFKPVEFAGRHVHNIYKTLKNEGPDHVAVQKCD